MATGDDPQLSDFLGLEVKAVKDKTNDGFEINLEPGNIYVYLSTNPGVDLVGKLFTNAMIGETDLCLKFADTETTDGYPLLVNEVEIYQNRETYKIRTPGFSTAHPTRPKDFPSGAEIDVSNPPTEVEVENV